METTLALALMVKNEEERLPRLLMSCSGFYTKILALDTGSTDGTVAYLKSQGAEVIEHPFEGFGPSRTRLLQFCQGKADWIMMLDADWTLKFDRPYREIISDLKPEVQAYQINSTGQIEFWKPIITRGSDKDWCYRGSAHEYLDNEAQRVTVAKLKGIRFSANWDPAKGEQKLKRNLELLQQDFMANPTNSRTVFYIACTYRDLGLYDLARTYFIQRASMGGWSEEVYFSRLEAACIKRDILELWECYALRPTRAESLFWLSRFYQQRGEVDKAIMCNKLRLPIPIPEEDYLFVDSGAYGPDAKAILSA
jgi:glycosyltransferase involved in cell wall biosynthesis